MRARTKKDQSDYIKERYALGLALGNEYDEAVKQAGIGEMLKRIERRLEPDYFEDRHLPPLFTIARTQEQKKQDKSKFIAYRYSIRDVIFRVNDESVRMKIIAILRKFHQLDIKYLQEHLLEARRGVEEASRFPFIYKYGLGIGGASIVALAWHFAGPMGGAAATVFAILTGLAELLEVEIKRRRNLEHARAEVEQAEAEVEDEVRKEIFSQLEEDTGEAEDNKDIVPIDARADDKSSGSKA